MPSYNVTRKSDLELVFTYTADAPVEWGGLEFDTHDHAAQPDAPAPTPPTPPRVTWTGLAFLRRFTVPERIEARARRASDPILDDFFALLEKADTVDSDDPDVTLGMAYLVGIGALTSARRDEIMEVSGG